MGGVELIFEYAEIHLETGDGMAEFVGDIAEEAFLAFGVAIEVGGHLIDGDREAADFIGATDRDANVEVACGDLFGGAHALADAGGDAADEGEPEQGGDGHGTEYGEEPGADIEEEAIAGDAGGDEEEHEGAVTHLPASGRGRRMPV